MSRHDSTLEAAHQGALSKWRSRISQKGRMQPRARKSTLVPDLECEPRRSRRGRAD
jgi:hypothetical protein